MNLFPKILLSVALLSACGSYAGAQWYLFKPQSPVSYAGSGSVRINLILPLKSSSEKPDADFMDFYSGALMAVRDYGKSGSGITLNVIDCTVPGWMEPGLPESDINIGPVSCRDIKSACMMLRDGEFIVSPLDPKAQALTLTDRVIQTPTDMKRQLNDIGLWVAADYCAGDRVVIVDGSDSAGNAMGVKSVLVENGIPFSTVSGTDAVMHSENGTLRIICVSSDKNLLASTAREAGAMGMKRGNVVLYTTSRIRSAQGYPLSALYNANTHMTASYHVDYSNESVKDFILAYRALFCDEPSQFAFSGYDIVHYFAGIYFKYGQDWTKNLSSHYERGLQSDFLFPDYYETGMSNVSVRRIVYQASDLTAVLK